MAGWFYPGRVGIPMPHMPMLPAHPAGPGVAQISPLMNLAAYGVPVNHTPGGMAMIQAGGGADAGPMLPPELPGMPKMPGPPDELFAGGPYGGGLFRPVAPVNPFDPGNQVGYAQNQGQNG